MTNWTITDFVVFLLMLTILIIVIRFIVRNRGQNTYSTILRHEVESAGLIFVSAQIPPKYFTGPFPQGRTPEGVCFPIGIAPWQYRKVSLRDHNNKDHVAWARIFLAAGSQPQVDWLPNLIEFTKQKEPG